ncbi:MAG: hypothetical protein DRP85_06505, partial [Candidatus Makaraimicrobium thalassicum]
MSMKSSIFKHIRPGKESRPGDDTRGVSLRCAGKAVRPWIRAVSLIVVVTFLSQQVSYGQVMQPPAAQPLLKGRVDLNQVSIPRDIAITKEINKTESDKLIINIKDVHDNYGAQESVVSVLENLAVNYDVRFIGIEGTEGYVDMNIVSAFPDAGAKKMAAQYLMRKGRLSAGEFFAALSETPVTLYGIDDSDLYLRNYNAFRNLLEKKDRNERLAENLRKCLFVLEDHVFSKELKQLNRNSVLNNSGEKRFTKRWHYIEDIGRRHGVERDNYPNVNALIKAVALEKTIDYTATNRQRDEVLNILTGRLERDHLEALILKSLSFKLGKISKSQFYSYILLLVKAEGLNRKYYNELETFCDYVNLYESIDIGGLMDEIDDYECRIKEKLFRNKDERQLTALMKNMEILHNLFAVKLTSGQLRYFRRHMEDFKWGNFLDFIRSRCQKYGIPIPAELAETKELFDQLGQAVDFYAAATGRNRAMVENTIKRMKAENVNVAAVVTGGFHTSGITGILKSDRVSYIILLPRFNPKTGKRPYISILTNKANEYERYAKSGDYLAFTSPFAMMEKILENTKMHGGVFRIRPAVVALLMGGVIAKYMEKGVVNPETWNRDLGEYFREYEKRERQTLARFEDMKETGKMTEKEYKEYEKAIVNSINFMKKLLGVIEIEARTGQVDVFFRTEKLKEFEQEGNLQYSVTFTGEGDQRQILLRAYEKVPGEAIEEVIFERSVRWAKIAGEKAVSQGETLLDTVQQMTKTELDRRISQYLSNREDALEQAIAGNTKSKRKLIRDIKNIAGRLGMLSALTDAQIEARIKEESVKIARAGAAGTVEAPKEEPAARTAAPEAAETEKSQAAAPAPGISSQAIPHEVSRGELRHEFEYLRDEINDMKKSNGEKEIADGEEITVEDLKELGRERGRKLRGELHDGDENYYVRETDGVTYYILDITASHARRLRSSEPGRKIYLSRDEVEEKGFDAAAAHETAEAEKLYLLARGLLAALTGRSAADITDKEAIDLLDMKFSGDIEKSAEEKGVDLAKAVTDIHGRAHQAGLQAEAETIAAAEAARRKKELQARLAHAPPVPDVTAEETAQVRSHLTAPRPLLAPRLKTLVNTINENPRLSGVLLRIAGDTKEEPSVRKNARKAMCMLLGLNVNVEKEFTAEDKQSVIEVYFEHSSDEKKRQIFDGVIDSALSEPADAAVRKNFEWLSGMLEKIKKVQDKGKTISAAKNAVNELLERAGILTEKLKETGDREYLSELCRVLGELLGVTTEEKKTELDRASREVLSGLKSILENFDRDSVPETLLGLRTSLDELTSTLTDISNNLPGILQDMQNLVEKYIEEGVSPVVNDVGKELTEKEEKTLDALWGMLRRTVAPRRISGRKKRKYEDEKAEIIDGFKKDTGIKNLFELINTGKQARGEREISIEEAVPERVKQLFEAGDADGALSLIERMLELHKLYEGHFHHLERDEIKKWAGWIKALSNTWGANIEQDADNEIKEYLGNLGEKGAGLLEEIGRITDSLAADLLQLEEELEKRQEDLDKITEMITSRTGPDKRRLTDEDIRILEKRQVIMEDTISQLNKEIKSLGKWAADIGKAKDQISDAVARGGELGEEVDTEELHQTLMTVFVRSRVQKRMGNLKDAVKKRADKILTKDKKGNYTEESMKEAYEAIEEYEKFMATACVDLSMKYVGGYDEGLYGVQLLAGLLSADGFIINLKTGEGKTEFSTVALTIASLTGLKAFAETSNINLARKDHFKRKKIFDSMNIRSAIYDHSALSDSPAERQGQLNELFAEETEADIVTFDTAGFNFMVADDLVKRDDEAEKIIKEGRKFMFVIIDEIDASMRAASTQYRIALQAPALEQGGAKYNLIEECVGFADTIVTAGLGRDITKAAETGKEAEEERIEKDYYYTVDRARGETAITSEGKKEIKAKCLEIAARRGVSDTEVYGWIEKAIYMIEIYKLDVHFSVVAGDAQLYDENGLVSTRRLSNGLHTVLEMYLRTVLNFDNVTVRDDSASKSEIGGGAARTEYFSVITGSSGTAIASEWELRNILGNEKGVADIPSNISRLFRESRKLIVDGKSDILDMLRVWVEQGIKRGKEGRYGDTLLPSFLYIRTTEQAKEIQNILNGLIRSIFSGLTIDVQVVDGTLEKDRLKRALDRSGTRNVITIFTDAGARGADYQAFLKNIRTLSPEKIAEQFSRLGEILDYLGEDVQGKQKELETILRTADKDENRDEAKRKTNIEDKLNAFFNELETKIEARLSMAENLYDAETAEILKEHLRGLNEFRTDVEVRYITGFRLLSQVSDKSIGDLLQALGRVGRQADPASFTLFFDINDKDEDFNILSNGYAEKDRRMGKAIRNMNEYRRLTDRLRKGETLTKEEAGRKDELRQKIYGHVFTALMESDLKGQKEREENHRKDLAVHKLFAKRIAKFRADAIKGTKKGLTGEEMAVKWIDDIVEQFEAADEEQAKKLRAFFLMAFGDNAETILPVSVETIDGNTISVRNLNKDTVKIFAEVLKALIRGRSYDRLDNNIKKAVNKNSFDLLSLTYSGETLLSERFSALFAESVTELLQYDYFEYVGGLRGSAYKSFEAQLNDWCKTRIRDMADLMPEKMSEICLEGIDKEVEKPASPKELKKEKSEKAKTFGNTVKSALKRVLRKKEGSAAGRVATAMAAGAGVGAAVCSLVPGIGSAAGAAVGGILGGLVSFITGRAHAELGWEEMKRKYGRRRALRYGTASVAKQAVKGATEGAVMGAVAGSILGAVIGGIAGAFAGGVGILPGILGGAKAGGLLGLKWGLIGGAGAGFLSNMIYGIDRVINPRARRIIRERPVERMEAEVRRARAAEEYAEPLARKSEYVREVQDERQQLFSSMFGKDEDGTPSPAVRDILAGKSEPAERAGSKAEIRSRITTRIITTKGGETAFVFEVMPEKQKDKKAPGTGTVSAEEQMEAFNMYLEGAGPPPEPGSRFSAPSFICIPCMSLSVQGEQGGSDETAANAVVEELLSQNEDMRRGGGPVCIFAGGISKTEKDAGHEFSGVVSMTYDQALAISKAAETSGAALDLTLPEGENTAIRTHNGSKLLLLRCDDGRLIVREFSRHLSTDDSEAMRAIVALAALKGKGRRAILDYGSPKAKREREKQKKKLGRMAGLLGQATGDENMETALQDPVVRDLMDNRNSDSGDILISPDGIFVEKPGSPSAQREPLVSFEGETTRIVSDIKAEVPATGVIALPLAGWRMKFLRKLMKWSRSRSARWEFWFKTRKPVMRINEKLKEHPKILKAVNAVCVSAPASILSLDFAVTFISGILVVLPESVNTRIMPWISEKFRDLTGRFKKETRPDEDKLLEFYSLPENDEDRQTLCEDWIGRDDSGVISAMEELAASPKEAAGYFDLAELLFSEAEETERTRGRNKARKVYALAEKFYYGAVYFDGKNALYHASFAKALDKQDKDDEALERVSSALRRRLKGLRPPQLDAEKKDEMLLIQAGILMKKNRFGEASESLRKLKTPEARKNAEPLEGKLYRKWQKQEKEDKKEQKGFWKSFGETLKYAFTGTKQKKMLTAAISTTIYLSLMYGLPFILGAPFFAGVIGMIQAGVISTMLMALGRIVIRRWIYEDIYKGRIKEGKKYSAAGSAKSDRRAEKKYASRNPEDIESHLRLIRHYVADGNTGDAVKHMEKAAALFSRHKVRFWLREYTSAENLALLASGLLDIAARDSKTRDDIRHLVSHRILREMRELPACRPYYLDFIAAKLAYRDNATDAALKRLDRIETDKLDLKNRINRDILLLRSAILRDRLKEEVNRPERNKKTIDDLIRKCGEIEQKAQKFSEKEDIQNMKAWSSDIAGILDGLNDKRSRQAGDAFKSTESRDPGEPMDPAVRESEEEPETDEVQTLEKSAGFDPYDLETKTGLSDLYLKNGEYAKAEDMLTDALKKFKGKKQRSKIAQRLALAYLLQNKKPGRRLLRKIQDARLRNIIKDIIALKADKRIDVGDLPGRLLPPGEAPSEIDDYNGLLLSVAIPVLTNDINVSPTKGFKKEPGGITAAAARIYRKWGLPALVLTDILAVLFFTGQTAWWLWSLGLPPPALMYVMCGPAMILMGLGAASGLAVIALAVTGEWLSTGVHKALAKAGLSAKARIKETQRFRKMRRSAWERVRELKGSLESRTFKSEEVEKKVKEALDAENLKIPAEKTAEDFRAGKGYRKTTKTIKDLTQELSRLSKDLENINSEIQKLKRKFKSSRKKDKVLGQRADAEEKKKLKILEIDSKRKDRAKYNSKARKMILDEQDPLILALLIEELTGLQKEYMEDAGEDAE